MDRDREILRFRPKTFYVIRVLFEFDGKQFYADLVNDEHVPGLDSEERLVSAETVKTILTALQDNHDATVLERKSELKNRKPPLCFSLSDVQSAASSAFGYSAEETLEICQSLYEKKLTTYPRTDCNYLPESQYADAPAVLGAIARTLPELSDAVSNADTSIRTKLWNDEKTTAHHAIIPTMSSGNASELSYKEKNIYRLAALRYVANFYPDFVYNQTVIAVAVDGLPYTFKASGRTTKSEGWRRVASDKSEENDPKSADNGKNVSQALPEVENGVKGKSLKAGFVSQTTTPPARFTEGTLIKAMENIYKYIEDPELNKFLKDGDGIGTSATRAGIISELKKRKFLEVKGKAIVSTEVAAPCWTPYRRSSSHR